MQQVRISIDLIKLAISEKWLKDLSFFCYLKHQFNNSCIYSYRSRMAEVAEKCHVSTRTLYTRLQNLRMHGLVKEHANNLMLKHINIQSTQILEIHENYSIKDISDLLYGKVLVEHARGQAFMESIRKFERGDKDKRHLRERPFKPSFSFRKIAQWFDVSVRKAYDLIKNLERLGFLRIEKQPVSLLHSNFPSARVVDCLPGYRYNIQDRLYEKVANRYEFLQTPIYLPRITTKSYKRLKKQRFAKNVTIK